MGTVPKKPPFKGKTTLQKENKNSKNKLTIPLTCPIFSTIVRNMGQLSDFKKGGIF